MYSAEGIEKDPQSQLAADVEEDLFCFLILLIRTFGYGVSVMHVSLHIDFGSDGQFSPAHRTSNSIEVGASAISAPFEEA